jgi:CRP-like cAMP-binding protein
MPLLPQASQPDRSPNGILNALSEADYEAVARLLDRQSLREREMLSEAGELPEYVYFPVRGVISLLVVLEDGAMIEFATIGRDGTSGVPFFLGYGQSNTALVSQVPGQVLKLRRRDFDDCVSRLPSLGTVIRRYSGVMLALVAQLAACNRAHHSDARCARWLLNAHDYAESDDLPVTQDFLAQMLGVSRPSIALSEGSLQRAGLVRYQRGEVHICDRSGLEAAACECYRVARNHLAEFARAPLGA